MLRMQEMAEEVSFIRLDGLTWLRAVVGGFH